MTHLSWRRAVNRLGFLVSGLATLIGLSVLAAILWTLVRQGLHSLTLATLTQMTPAPGSEGGLLNAIVGSLIMTGLGIAIATPVGILAGIYLSEYGRGRLSTATRFVNDVLLSAPSIIVGLFVYTVMVVPMRHFSALAGALSLAIIAVPVTVRTAEDMLRLVSANMREASAALGAQPWRTVSRVVLPAAHSGLITGVLLAMARISGETAPAPVHRTEQPVLEQESKWADGEPAGGDLPVRYESLQELAVPRLGGRAVDHLVYSRAQRVRTLRAG